MAAKESPGDCRFSNYGAASRLMIRPIYRWKSFWLGVLVLIFMGWAWAISVGRYSGAQVVAGAAGGISLAQHNSEIVIFYNNGGYLGSWRFDTFDETGFTGPADERYWGRITSEKGVLIRHAHIIGLFLIAWTAFLAWRWWRMRRGISSRDFSQA